MEGWQTRRRAARFRGLAITVLESTREGGRRLDEHEFANREIPYAEDTGRRKREFSVRGVIFGPDHDLEAEQLEAAFETKGPGELVLPHRAPIQVAVRRYSIQEPERSTRVQFWEAEFVEAGLAVAPKSRENTAGIVQTRTKDAWTALGDRFAKVFTLGDQTQAQIDRISGIVKAGAAEVEAAFQSVTAGQPILEEIAAAAQSVDDFKQRISRSIVDGAAVALDFQDRLDDLLALPLAPLNVYRRLAKVVPFGIDLADPGAETSSRKTFKRNQDAFVAMLSQSATATRAKALSLATFESSTEAAEFRKEIAAELDAAILAASDAFADEAADRLRALRTATIRDLDARAARLPARVSYRLAIQTASIVVAQRLYGDVTREPEIVARNRRVIHDPGRIAAGTVLEVLVDV